MMSVCCPACLTCLAWKVLLCNVTASLCSEAHTVLLGHSLFKLLVAGHFIHEQNSRASQNAGPERPGHHTLCADMGSGRQRVSLTHGHCHGYAYGNGHVRFVADLQQEQGKAGLRHGMAGQCLSGQAWLCRDSESITPTNIVKTENGTDSQEQQQRKHLICWQP